LPCEFVGALFLPHTDIEKENINKYERAFKLVSTGQICIVMELAANDLYTHLKSRKNVIHRDLKLLESQGLLISSKYGTAACSAVFVVFVLYISIYSSVEEAT